MIWLDVFGLNDCKHFVLSSVNLNAQIERCNFDIPFFLLSDRVSAAKCAVHGQGHLLRDS
jgi:hypothetical protein